MGHVQKVPLQLAWPLVMDMALLDRGCVLSESGLVNPAARFQVPSLAPRSVAWVMQNLHLAMHMAHTGTWQTGGTARCVRPIRPHGHPPPAPVASLAAGTWQLQLDPRAHFQRPAPKIPSPAAARRNSLRSQQRSTRTRHIQSLVIPKGLAVLGLGPVFRCNRTSIQSFSLCGYEVVSLVQ